MSTLLGTMRILNQQKACVEKLFDSRSPTKGSNAGDGGKDDDMRHRGSLTPMITPTFCMASPILPEVLNTDAIGLQSLLPEAEYQKRSRQMSLRNMTESKPLKAKSVGLNSLFQHLTSKTELSENKLKRKCRAEDESRNLEKKLKTDSCKSLMLPQDTPPLSAKRKPAVLVGIKPMTEDEKRSAAVIPTTTGILGSSCHQCKSKREMNKLYYCSNTANTNKPKDKRVVCRKKYCGQCLEKYYRMKIPKNSELPRWSCPACQGRCCCASCRSKKASNATHIEDARTMSPATSLACGLVFGDILDRKDALTLEEARASVDRVLQKQMTLHIRKHEKKTEKKADRKGSRKHSVVSHPQKARMKNPPKGSKAPRKTKGEKKTPKTAKHKAQKSKGPKQQRQKQSKQVRQPKQSKMKKSNIKQSSLNRQTNVQAPPPAKNGLRKAIDKSPGSTIRLQQKGPNQTHNQVKIIRNAGQHQLSRGTSVVNQQPPQKYSSISQAKHSARNHGAKSKPTVNLTLNVRGTNNGPGRNKGIQREQKTPMKEGFLQTQLLGMPAAGFKISA